MVVPAQSRITASNFSAISNLLLIVNILAAQFQYINIMSLRKRNLWILIFPFIFFIYQMDPIQHERMASEFLFIFFSTIFFIINEMSKIFSYFQIIIKARIMDIHFHRNSVFGCSNVSIKSSYKIIL